MKYRNLLQNMNIKSKDYQLNMIFKCKKKSEVLRNNYRIKMRQLITKKQLIHRRGKIKMN